VRAGPVLSVASATVLVGDTFDIAVSISAVDAAEGLSAWQFDLGFDPSIVRANGVSEGGYLSAFGTTLFGPGVIDATSGLISLVTDAYIDLPPAPFGDGVLALISFTALADGKSALTFFNAFLDYASPGADPLNGLVTVGPLGVPEPGTTGLVALATMLLLAARRWRRHAASSHLDQPTEGQTT
jgi:general secretion pathway protein D